MGTRFDVLSLRGLGMLTKHKLWSDAFQRVVALGVVHPNAQQRFLNAWCRVGSSLRQIIDDDPTLCDALRVLLPCYRGPPVSLYRGESARRQHIGLSWTRSYHLAEKFALYGIESVRSPRRGGGVVLHTIAEEVAIISAPCLLGGFEGEYIVDPRRLTDVTIIHRF